MTFSQRRRLLQVLAENPTLTLYEALIECRIIVFEDREQEPERKEDKAVDKGARDRLCACGS